MSATTQGYLSEHTTVFTNVRALGDLDVDGVLTVQELSADSHIGMFSGNTLNAESGNTVTVLSSLSLTGVLRAVDVPSYPALSLESLPTRLTYAYGDVRRYGAVGDGTTDDRAAIQRAIDSMASLGGGRVYIPPVNVGAGQFYAVNGPLFVKSRVVVSGDGDASYIKSIATTNTPYPQESVFCMGLFHPAYFQDLTYYALNSIATGAQTITCTTAGDASNFTTGEPIVIRSAEHWDQTDGANTYYQPLYQKITRVRAISGATITLDHPIDEALTGAEVARTNAGVVQHLQLKPVYVCDRGGIENLSVYSPRYWMAEGGMLECTIRNILVRWSAALVYGNTICHSLIENIRGIAYRKFLELACGSHNTIVRNIQCSFATDPSAVSGNFMQLSEQCRDVIVDGFIVQAADRTIVNDFFLLSISKRVRVKNGVVYAQGTPGVAIFLSSTSRSPDIPDCSDNVIEDIEWHAGTPSWYVRMEESAGSAKLKRNKIRRINFVTGGAPTNNFNADVTGQENEVSDCYFPGGLLRIVTAADRCIVERNYSALGLSGVETASVLQVNRIRDNESARSREYRKLTRVQTSEAAVTTTVANTEFARATMIADSARPMDEIRFVVAGRTFGTVSTKDIQLVDQTGSLIAISFLAAETGTFLIDGYVKVKNTGTYSVVLDSTKVSTTTPTRVIRTVDLTTTAFYLSLQAWKGNSGDGLTIERFDVYPMRPGHAVANL